jgi:CheY-like chemotaxis protein
MSDATTVLLIDDDPRSRDYNAQRLHASSVNYDVVHAATGRSGLDICARQPIDCVVLEIDLPDIRVRGVSIVGSPPLSSRDRRHRPDKVSQSILVRPRDKERCTSRISKKGGK